MIISNVMDDQQTFNSLGDYLRHSRTLRGLSQRDLSSELGVSQVAIVLWESGQNTPSVESLARLTVSLDLNESFCLELVRNAQTSDA